MRSPLSLCFSLLLSVAMATPASASSAGRLADALELQASGRLDAAGALAARASDPLVAALVTWDRLTDGEGSWDEMTTHLDRYPNWPRNHRIRFHAERAMPPGLDPAWVVAFFAEPARTGTGALRHAAALRALGQEAEAEAVLRRAWTQLSLREAELEAFRADHPALTARHAAARADAMLWDGALDQAEAILPLLDNAQRRLAAARIALQARRNGVDTLIDAIPASLAGDPGLAHDRFVWRLRSDLDDSAVSLLAERSASPALLGRPEAWGRSRAAQVRRLLREDRVREAYVLASNHHIDSGADFADLEWLAGWIALRLLDEPRVAALHFENIWQKVETPISLGRAGYWTGRALAAAGDAEGSRAWHARAAEHATSFYGQLSAAEIGVEPTRALTRESAAPNPALLDTSMVRAARLLDAAGEDGDTYAFLLALASGQSTEAGFAAAGQFALALDRPEAAVRIGKMAARAGYVVMDIYYPLHEAVSDGGPVDPALALAIARQESEFNPRAVSHAGARGLMQLMPTTAQRVARELGTRHSTARLTDDPAHNIQLGKAYLASRMERFDGAAILAAAAYNAGAGRVEEWIERFGDPRDPAVDAIDWIETIPFSETRNYVQRVMESYNIYRARLGRAPVDLAAAMIGRRG
jgi:soluble lytic murein transglycosylase